MIIKNFKQLATTKTREDALKIINSGIESVLTKPAIKKQVVISKGILKIGRNSWNLDKFKRIFVVGAGKAAVDMADEVERIFGKRITKGIVIDTRAKKLKRIKVVKGTHPLSSEANLKGTKEIIKILKESKEDDLVISLISGGGSALMAAPRVSLKKQVEVNKLLLKSGATIQEINTVRKHISDIKGGQLAKLAEPSTLITLIVSDVITNDLDVIASGPTVRDRTTMKDALKISKKYNLPELPFVETPKKISKNVTNVLLITNVLGAESMSAEAKNLGYKSRILTVEMKGEAREVGRKLARMAKPGKALIVAGETTVTVVGKGKGGRNQELATSASQYIKNGVVVSCSSDGVDFIEDAAGGIVDENTGRKGLGDNLFARDFLEKNDTYNFLSNLNGIIKTGKTGTNVCDFIVVLGNKKSS